MARARTAESVARTRMVGLGLWGRPAADPGAVVRHLVAMQAQEHAYARWSVGQRCNARASEVDQAFDAGELLRTHVLRPTWHFVAPDDLRALLALTGARIDATAARRYAELGLDARTRRRADDVIADAVSSGPQTRQELAMVLQRRRIAPDGQRLPHLLMSAELHAVVCSGPMRGKQHTYAAFGDRVPPAPPVDEDDALADLARRWFTTRGPATLRDFSWWSGLRAADARRALTSVQSELESYEHDGRTSWFREWRRAPTGPRVDLVQCYDETIISYTESRDVLATDTVAFPVPGGRDGFAHVLLAGGRLLGHWRARRASTGVVAETLLAREVDAAEQAALDAALDRYEEFART
jgi:hypothetical protein